MKQKSGILITLFCLTALLLFAPLIQQNCKPFKFKKLSGYLVVAEKPKLTFDTYRSGDFQREAVRVIAGSQGYNITRQTKLCANSCLIINEYYAYSVRAIRHCKGVFTIRLYLHTDRHNSRFITHRKRVSSHRCFIRNDGEDVRLIGIELLGHIFAKAEASACFFIVA